VHASTYAHPRAHMRTPTCTHPRAQHTPPLQLPLELIAGKVWHHKCEDRHGGAVLGHELCCLSCVGVDYDQAGVDLHLDMCACAHRCTYEEGGTRNKSVPCRSEGVTSNKNCGFVLKSGTHVNCTTCVGGSWPVQTKVQNTRTPTHAPCQRL